jgi:putative DNA primase/helicase
MYNDFKDFITELGLIPPDTLISGKINYFAGLNKTKTNKAARCFLFEDGRGGWVMDYSTGLYAVWQAERTTPYSEAERKAFAERCEQDRKQRESDEAEAKAKAARKAKRFFNAAINADAVYHCMTYLQRKKIKAHGAKTGNSGSLKGVLIIPLYNEKLALVNVQFIAPDGTKRFLSGGQKKHCFWWIGKKSSTVLIAEGYATACSLHEATGHQVFIAFDAGNLSNVARIVRAKNPTAEIIIAGDNDLSNTGQDAARLAALAVNGKYIIPPIAGMDWNDYLSSGGVL